MKKKLLLLPLAALMLTGCKITLFGKTIYLFEKKPSSNGDSGESTKSPKAPSADLVINHDALADKFEEDYVYPQQDYEFKLEDFVFKATSGVGHKTAEQDETHANYYNEQGALQFRKANHETGTPGVIQNYDPIIASKITIHWFATYASEPSQYHPVVKIGDKFSNVGTAVSCNEGSTVSGVDTGSKQYMNNDDREVYLYTTTYNLSKKHFFSIGAPNGAMYVKDIVIHK